MIIIEYENIKLRLLQEADLELVRNWRNQDHVSQFMEYRESIGSNDQKSWFEQLDKTRNLYFIIEVSELPIGVVNLKDIHWEQGAAEAGVFVGQVDFMGGISPIFSVLVLMQFAFRCLSLQVLSAKISNKNTNAIQFNHQLGYRLTTTLNNEFGKYECSSGDFYSPQSQVSKLNHLFSQHAGINVYVDAASDWILDHLHVDDRTFYLRKM